ncbi:MAG: hypothetical protein KJI72_02330 [Patescibacteria group bacterium]|nr:hypothetical protein [Patescibacteria group bacterium]
MGVSKLAAAVILSTVSLFLVPLPAVIVTLFKPTGIPIDAGTVGKGSAGLAFSLIVILMVSGVNTEGWFEKWKGWFSGDAQPAAAQPATARTVSATSTPQTIEVDSVWVRVAIPFRHWLQTIPDDTIEMRLLDGRVFDIAPDGEAYINGELVRDGESAVDVIPGFAVDIHSKSGVTTSVTISALPKGS